MNARFWESKSPEQMSAEEWERLCDGCARCCLHKLEDEESGELHHTSLACSLLDIESCRCSNYSNRFQQIPECIQLTVERATEFSWLPDTCAYRLIAEGKPLQPWHPLLSGDPDSVHDAGISIRNFAISASSIPEDHWCDCIIPMTEIP